MTIHKIKTVFNIAVFSLSLVSGATVIPQIATAADDDEIYCFDFVGANGKDETECGTIGDYKAECALTDPQNTSDLCKDVNQPSRATMGGKKIQSKRQ